MVGKDGRWGYLEKKGTLKNMEPGEVGVREMVLHSHSLVCRDAKRDLFYTRRHTRSCQCGKRGEVGLRQKGITWEVAFESKNDKIPRVDMAFFTPNSGCIIENKLAKGNETSAGHPTRCYLSASGQSKLCFQPTSSMFPDAPRGH